MATTDGLLRFTGMSYEASVQMSERVVMNPQSLTYMHLRSALARRLAAMKELDEKKKLNGRRRRIVVSNVLEPEQIHKLAMDYGQFDLVFKQNERACGSLAKAVYFISVEKLFDNVKGKWAQVIAFGVSLNHLIMQNRHWVHLCVQRESAEVAARSVKDDRSMCAVLNAARKKNKPLPLTDVYASGKLSQICCSDPLMCKRQGPVGVVMLTNIDTNYYQLCVWMLQHGVKLLYFAFPCTKATEMQYDADIPDLGARVVHEGDKFHILYKNATSMSQTYTYKNHLSLIGKSHQVIGDKFFFKEYSGYQNSVAFYKVTMSKNQYPASDQVYRSWMNKGYDTRYLVDSFELRNGVVDIFNPLSYIPYRFEVDRQAVDKLIEYSMGLENEAFTYMSIARRLRTYVTTTVHSGYNLVSSGLKLDDKEFTHLVLAVYSRCFMKRFVSGASLAFMTGQDRDLRYLRDCGAISLIPYTLGVMVHNGLVVPFKRLFGWIRQLYDRWFGGKRVSVPKITLPESFVVYKDTVKPGLWEQIKSWASFEPKPWDNFSPYLPGFSVALRLSLRSFDAVHMNPVFLIKLREAMHDSVEPVWQDRGRELLIEGLSDDVASANKKTRGLLMTEHEVERGETVRDQTVVNLTNKVMDGNDGHLDLTRVKLYTPQLLNVPDSFVDAHSGTVDDPFAVLSTVMGRIFPESTLMQTDGVAGDIHYGDMEIVARAVRIKIDGSKLAPLRPEKIFRPVMPNQVLPNAKQTMQAVLPTVVKRNLNTTSSVDSLDVDALWDRTWRFMKDVYYVPDVEEKLAEMEPIMPTVETVAVWASKLDEASRVRAVDVSYTTETLHDALANSSLMLKAKRKTNMGPSYDTAVKAAQSIQYDGTKARTGVYSPIFAEKVRRDKTVLRDNVFIMQSKSPADLNQFLSAYRWHRPGLRPLRYLEMDAEMFDKSQVLSTLMMHWKKCEKFGILPSYLKLLEEGVSYRSASSIQAGVKVFITPQRGSGDSDTLDGNCDVSQAAYARFLSRFVQQIEFILIMGDDVTVAVRGEVDFQDVEADCMTEFNLSVKLTESAYGYFVSGWLLHMPDGSITWRTDPVKRALSLGDQSVSDQVDLHERFVGYKDLCQGLEGYATQQVMSEAIADRYGRAMGHVIDPKDVVDMIKSVSTVSNSFDAFRKFFSKEIHKRFA